MRGDAIFAHSERVSCARSFFLGPGAASFSSIYVRIYAACVSGYWQISRKGAHARFVWVIDASGRREELFAVIRGGGCAGSFSFRGMIAGEVIAGQMGVRGDAEWKKGGPQVFERTSRVFNDLKVLMDLLDCLRVLIGSRATLSVKLNVLKCYFSINYGRGIYRHIADYNILENSIDLWYGKVIMKGLGWGVEWDTSVSVP